MQDINFLVEQKNGTIGMNFDEVKATLSNGLEEYRHMTFTEDSKTEAKKTVASLRKLKKTVNDKKNEVKKSFMVPYTDFETKVKELDKLIDEPINFINAQVETFERNRVEERKRLISEIYDEVIAENEAVAEYLPLQRIYDSKWENATTTKKAIKEAITEHIEHVEKDLATIRAMESEFEDKGLEKYKITLELSDAIGSMNQYQEQKEEIIKCQKEDEERKRVEEERKKEAEQLIVPTAPEVPNELFTQEKEEFVKPKPCTDTIRYEVTADPFQVVQLESAMREYGIEFRRV
jgi:hypothetical protein